MKIKFRTWGKGLPPKPIKLQIPGWAGSEKTYKKAQPWQCMPFIEGSTYGLELIYPFDAETKVTMVDGKINFEGNFEKECIWSETPTPPFAAFSDGHYGFTSCLDISYDKDFVLRLEPHPRFFTDTTGECPIAIPGHLHSWWCKIFFVVFKAPKPGEVHVFRKDEPYAQILIIPKKPDYELEKMDKEEVIERQFVEQKIDQFKNLISKKSWKDDKGNFFDDKYKQLSAIYNKEGFEGIKKILSKSNKPVKQRFLGKLIRK